MRWENFFETKKNSSFGSKRSSSFGSKKSDSFGSKNNNSFDGKKSNGLRGDKRNDFEVSVVHSVLIISLMIVFIVSVILTSSCSGLTIIDDDDSCKVDDDSLDIIEQDRYGILLVSFTREYRSSNADIMTNNAERFEKPLSYGFSREMPDSNSFILSIKEVGGEYVYKDLYSQRPDTLLLSVGTYDVEVYSREFTAPEFDAPCYYDSGTVLVEAGKTTSFSFLCRQVNCGLRLGFTSEFKMRFANYVVEVEDSKGKALYSYTESRFLYLTPGDIFLRLKQIDAYEEGGSKNYGSSGSNNYDSSGSKNYGLSDSKKYGSSGSNNYGLSGSNNYGLSDSKKYGSSGSNNYGLSDSKNYGSSGSNNYDPSGSFLITRKSIAAMEMVTVNLHSSTTGGGGSGGENPPSNSQVFTGILIDTSSVWISDDIVVGERRDGSSKELALTVDEIAAYVGAKEVWVSGYVVGYLTKGSLISLQPFENETNIALAAVSAETDRELCAGVSLTAGPIRNALNLKYNPGNIGKKVFVKGKIVESYFGLVGVNNVKEYFIE